MPWFRFAQNDEKRALTNEHYGSASWDRPLRNAGYFVIDIETSGFSPQTDIVLSVASLPMTLRDANWSSNLHYELVGHRNAAMVPEEVLRLTGLSVEDFAGKREWRDILFDTLKSSSQNVWVAHHALHEVSFLQKSAREFWRLRLQPIVIDTALVAQALFSSRTVPTLEEVCTRLDVPLRRRHQADEDVLMTAEVWKREVSLCEAMGLSTVGQVVEWSLARAHG